MSWVSFAMKSTHGPFRMTFKLTRKPKRPSARRPKTNELHSRKEERVVVHSPQKAMRAIRPSVDHIRA